jgi:WD40 repeat protein
MLGCLVYATPISAHKPKSPVTLRGHTDMVRCVAFSPDGKTLVSGGIDNTIRFWDLATGKERASVKKVAEYGVDSVAFSPDGKTLAVGIGGSGVKIYDVRSRKPRIFRDEVWQYATPRVVFSPDGKVLASGGPCIREIRLWNVATGKNTITLKGHDEYGLDALAFRPDGKTIASVGHDGALNVWDVATGKNKARRKLAKWIADAAISPDGKTVATRICIVETIKGMDEVTDNSVKVWDTATGKALATLPVHNDIETGCCMAFSPDGKRLVTVAEDKAIKLWDVTNGKALATLQGNADDVLCFAFRTDGKKLASGSKDKMIKIWDVAKVK